MSPVKEAIEGETLYAENFSQLSSGRVKKEKSYLLGVPSSLTSYSWTTLSLTVLC